MNSWNGRGGARPGLVSATHGRVGLSVELDEALARVRALGLSVTTAESHEQRVAELKEIIGEARRALVVSTSLASDASGDSGVLPRRSQALTRPVAPTEWLLRSVVHDLNNMLLVIQNCTGSLRHQENAAVQREAHVVQDAVNQATRLVAKLVPSDPGIGRPSGVDLSDCVERFSGVIGSLVGEPIDVVTRLASDLPLVRCEETALFRVLSNLAANARDAMPAGGTLTIETSGVTSLPEGGSLRASVAKTFALLRVIDTGEGMDARTFDRAFEPFFTTKAPVGGTGVGLTAVREIVESIGGLVQMESSPGFGTKVSVYLECAELPA